MATSAKATIEDLYRVREKAELVGGEILVMSPTGGLRGEIADAEAAVPGGDSRSTSYSSNAVRLTPKSASVSTVRSSQSRPGPALTPRGQRPA